MNNRGSYIFDFEITEDCLASTAFHASFQIPTVQRLSAPTAFLNIKNALLFLN